MKGLIYSPDFDAECSVCGASPTVVVNDHAQPATELCGPCFFSDRSMLEWELWNEPQEATE